MKHKIFSLILLMIVLVLAGCKEQPIVQAPAGFHIIKAPIERTPFTVPIDWITIDIVDEIVEEIDSEPIKHVDEKVVYLTFDDGPSKQTEQILQILADYDAKATFFYLVPNMIEFPDKVREVAMNHTIGHHGVSHNKEIIYRSASSVVEEMMEGQDYLYELTGISSNLIRAPFGSSPYMVPEYKQAVRDAGFILWDWTIDSRDWQYRDGRYIDEVITQYEKLSSDKPVVILLHEHIETVEHLPTLLNYFAQKGYTFRSLNESLPAYVNPY
ncbi:polysaccharide deacetylase [Bacillus luteolus]|uniref:Polysaccharide deacetylase n=1 Tax=Litchfieldia luteola TaxID=682179 RepID=A0ABR9QMA9_9BACI|nr:polysaccharide deacetylase family protein [Cytobacillus luteolus]MBE4909632.1 polysaccharide deacetylase [Cytobacillus luteolus]MBP1941033.1 peptidoglycan/xylan/chitin deacetylase (PgdA/CDA1 family) [Cytobacillus luteolus]